MVENSWQRNGYNSKKWRAELNINIGSLVRARKDGDSLIIEPTDKPAPYRIYSQSELENFIADHHFVVRSEIAEREIKRFKTIVIAKDAHVLAGALLCRCEYLLTLDKKHLDNEGVKNKFSEAIITSLKEFLQYFRK